MFSLEEEEREQTGLWVKFTDFLFAFRGGGGVANRVWKEEATSLQDQAGKKLNLSRR